MSLKHLGKKESKRKKTGIRILDKIVRNESNIPYGSDFWRSISMANPMLYVVNTFREGMLGVSDVSISFSLTMIGIFIIIFSFLCLYLLKKGIGIRT